MKTTKTIIFFLFFFLASTSVKANGQFDLVPTISPLVDMEQNKEQKIKNGLALVEEAAKQGDSKAQVLLACLLLLSSENLMQQAKSNINWEEEKETSEAVSTLLVMSTKLYVRLAESSMKQAKIWLGEAAKQGNSEAQQVSLDFSVEEVKQIALGVFIALGVLSFEEVQQVALGVLSFEEELQVALGTRFFEEVHQIALGVLPFEEELQVALGTRFALSVLVVVVKVEEDIDQINIWLEEQQKPTLPQNL